VKHKIGDKELSLTYEPGDTTSDMFSGNSNWRGPIWTPLNHLVIESLYCYHDYLGNSLLLPSKEPIFLEQAALDLVERLVSLFKRNAEGKRPFYGENEYFQSDPNWRDYIWFYEHFHAETGSGLGATHQNGWTAMVAKLIHTRGRAVFIPQPLALAQDQQSG